MITVEIAPKSLFLCVNRSHIRYGFHAGAKTIRYYVNMAMFSQVRRLHFAAVYSSNPCPILVFPSSNIALIPARVIIDYGPWFQTILVIPLYIRIQNPVVHKFQMNSSEFSMELSHQASILNEGSGLKKRLKKLARLLTGSKSLHLLIRFMWPCG